MSDSIQQNADDELRRIVDKHVDQLAEHFDGVQIFVNRLEGDRDQTRGINRGAGNWFSRYGQIHEWVVFEEERMRNNARDNDKSP